MIPFAKLLPLLALKGKSLQDLSLEDLGLVASTLGIRVSVTEELKQAGIALLKGENIDTVADMIQSPDSIRQVMLFLQGKTEEDLLAEGELISMYQGDVFGEGEGFVPSPPHVAAVKAAPSVSANDLISNSLVGWRLKG